MTQSPRISCALHDYIEIACMYGYRIRLDLTDGQIVEGKAINIVTTPEKRELLLIDEEQRQIELTQLRKMTVLTKNAVFKEVTF